MVQAFSQFFLSLFSFSSSPPRLPFSSFSFFFPSLSSFPLLSSVLFLTVLPTFVSLYPHLSLSASLLLSLSSLRFCDFFGSFSTCPSLLGVSGDGVQRKSPRSRLPSSFQAIAGLPTQVPAGQQHRSFSPHYPERAFCVPNFPGISRRPRRTMPHILSPILSGGHLTQLLQTLLILTLEDSLDFSSHPQTSRLGTFQCLTPSPQPQRSHLGPGQAAAAPGTLHTACRSPRRYIPTWASKRRCQRAH